MKHSNRTRNVRQTSHKAKRQKQQQQRLFILLFITFVFGLLIGFWIGSKRTQPVNFIMGTAPESEVSESPANTTPSTTPTKNHIDNDSLPWNLQLVNYEYALAEDFEPEALAEVNNGYETDSRIVEAAKQMLTDASAENVRIIALSAYRDYEYQTRLYEKKVKKLQREKGYSVDKAREEAATVVAYPGTSEHQLGLALDLVDAGHTKLDESQEDTAAYKWLYEHCDEYGFIVRYPNGKTDITGIIYEPWHFRYVGVEAATTIMNERLTLEEYLQKHYK